MAETLEIIEVVNTLEIEEENVNLLSIEESEINILTEYIPGPQGEPGEGVPTGGVTGQVLAKASNADFETEWVSPSAGSDAHFAFPQVGAAMVWSVEHNLGKYPAVMVVDSAGTVVVGDIDYVDANNLTVSFAYAFSGTVYLN